MAQVLPLGVLARLVTVQALLDRTQDGDSALSRCLILKLKSDCYTAVTSSVLTQIVKSCPASLTNTLLLALAPPHLRHLELNKCYYVSAMGIERTLKKCQRLERLDLEECNQLMRPTFFRLCGHLASQLIALTLDNCDKVTDEVVKSALQSLPSLRKLSLSQCQNITDDVFLLDKTLQLTRQSQHKVLRSTGYQYHLTDVNVSGCHGLTSSSIRHLTTLCGPSLERLDISWMKMDCTALWYLSGFSLASAVHFALSIDKLQLENELDELIETGLDNATTLLEKEQSLCNLEKAYEETVSQLQELEICDGAQGQTLALTEENTSVPESPVEDCSACHSHDIQSNDVDDPLLKHDTGDFMDPVHVHHPDGSIQSAENACFVASSCMNTPASMSGADEDIGICPSSTAVNSNSESSNPSRSQPGRKAASQPECLLNHFSCSQDIADNSTQASAIDSDSKCEHDVENSPVPGLVKIDRAFVINHSVHSFPYHESTMDSESEDKLAVVELCDHEAPSGGCSSDGSAMGDIADLGDSDDTILEDCTLVKYASSLESLPDEVPCSHSHIPTIPSSDLLLTQPSTSVAAAVVVNDSVRDECLVVLESTDAGMDIATATNDVPPSDFSKPTEDDSAEAEINNEAKYKPSFTPHLLYLDIANLHFPNTDLGNACLKAFFAANPNIQSFSTTWKGLQDDMLIYIAEHAPRLTHLSLVECDGLSNMGVSSLGSKCPNLRNLNLQAVNFISDPALMNLVALGNLQSLNVAESNITDRLLHKIATRCPDHLKELDLSWCEEIAVEGIDAIAMSCVYLESLSLRQCPRKSGISDLLENCKALKELSLSSLNCITDETVVGIALRFHHLTKIDFSWNMDITNIGIQVLMSTCMFLIDAILTGIKRITSSPFLPIISNLKEWKKCQALMRFKRHERDVFRTTGDPHMSSSDEEFEALCLPQRSTCYVPHLRFLDIVYCDKVNDSHMASLVAVCRGTLTVRDYYGQDIKPSWITCQSGQAFIAPIINQ